MPRSRIIPMISASAAHRCNRAVAARLPTFNPAPGLRNAHAQTLYGTLARRSPDLMTRVEEWTTPDDDFVMVHIIDPPARGAPIALLLHGLEGSARSPYVRGLGRQLRALGYGVVAFEQRSCSGRLNRARRLYHSGVTDDLAFVIGRIGARWPGAPVFAAGVSLGGNQLGRWLGTEAVPDFVRAAALVSPPFDLTVSGPHMDRRQIGYVRYFLRTLIPKALAKERQYPGCLDPRLVRSARDFDRFDTHATAALHGFADAQDYYRTVSCGQYLFDVRTPTLLVAASDDPFNPGTTLPRRVAESSPFLLPCFLPRGGHVGFVGGRMTRPRYWLESAIPSFFEAHRVAEA